ncbi:MAG: glycoside hydrolase family 43 protein [Candidatus Pristimantibacillus sp.]
MNEWSATFRNPILPGFYPDPSICRVGEDYYMVTSSFEYYPGVPIFHSKDLVHWEQLGHVLDRPSQLELDGTPCSKGIYAATIRYHNGLFYMITTFVVSQMGERRNFYVTAENPAGAWSDPIWLPDAPGIDSSFFFDDDDKVYIMANRVPPEGQQYPKHMEIWLQQFDLPSQQLIGDKYSLWDGALKVAHAQEGPHIYKKDGYYYLLIAEGGTGFTHAVTVARSRHITGPYEGCKSNPILTHRHLGQSYGIVNVGHADLVETTNGEWWMVCLASRPYGGAYRNLGRETFLVPVAWEEGWPVVNPGKGIVELESYRPNLPEHVFPDKPACDSFESEILDDRWNFIRTPRGDFWSLTERPGYLRLQLKPETIAEPVNPSFVGRRQQHMCFTARTVMEFIPQADGEAAGIVLLQNHDYLFRFEYVMDNGAAELRLVERRGGTERVVASRGWSCEKVYLKVEAEWQSYRFLYASKSEQWETLAEHVDGTLLSSDVAGGFVGTYIGLYATANGTESSNYVDFDWFEYGGIE